MTNPMIPEMTREEVIRRLREVATDCDVIAEGGGIVASNSVYAKSKAAILYAVAVLLAVPPAPKLTGLDIYNAMEELEGCVIAEHASRIIGTPQSAWEEAYANLTAARATLAGCLLAVPTLENADTTRVDALSRVMDLYFDAITISEDEFCNVSVDAGSDGLGYGPTLREALDSIVDDLAKSDSLIKQIGLAPLSPREERDNGK